MIILQLTSAIKQAPDGSPLPVYLPIPNVAFVTKSGQDTFTWIELNTAKGGAMAVLEPAEWVLEQVANFYNQVESKKEKTSNGTEKRKRK